MKSATASSLHRITLAVAGLALAVAPVGYGNGTRSTASLTPMLTNVGHTMPAAPGGPLTITSPAFADGASIPVQYSCKGANIAPPLTWVVPLGGALIVDDTDAAGGSYIHWIVIGIPPGPGSTSDGQTPAGGTSLPNSAGQAGYSGPCPPAGTGVHHYRFTLYQVPATLQLPPGAVGPQAAQTITQATTGQAQYTGTFQLALHG